jgi:hypothetical protein
MTESFAYLGDREFIVTAVVETRPPRGASGGSWFRYTIENRFSPISGIRSGSLETVRRHAEEFAETLNLRALKGYSAYATRKDPKK